MKRWVPLIAVVLALLPLPAGADTARFKAFGDPGSFHWHPEARRIEPGDKIVWANATGTRHTVTAYKGKWDKDASIEPEGKTAAKFPRAGTYRFRCTLHSTLTDGVCDGMCGTVKVRAP